MSGNASVFVLVFCFHFLRFRFHFDYFLDQFWGLWGIKKKHALSRACRGGPQEHFVFILASFWNTLTPFCVHFGCIVTNIAPKLSIKYTFAYFFQIYMEDKKLHAPIRTYTHIHAHTHLHARIYACMHIYTYIHIRQQEKIDAMNFSSLGPPRWSAKRPNARGSPYRVLESALVLLNDFFSLLLSDSEAE